MSDTAYHQSRAISGTDMRLASKDFEAWAFERRLKLDGEMLPWLQADEPSKAMNFGTAVHMAILEPDRYEALKVVMPYVENFALKAGKAIREEHEAKAQEKDGILLRCEEAWAIEKILVNWRQVVDSVFPLGSTFQVEHRVFRDLEGVPCRGTLDGLCQGTVIDLKTTRDIHKAQDTIHWERYSVQVAHYAHLVGCFSLKIVFIENTMPYRVRAYLVDYDKAKSLWEATISKIKDAGLA
jgi:PDDEXK-like domain of unknown function (DUF3799)